MTRDEVKKIVMIITSSFPNWKPNDLSFTVDTWFFMLEEYGYNEIALALKTYITSDASGFAPSIGQLVDKLKTISSVPELSEMEAWSLVSRALRNGYYGAEVEFEKLPKTVQKAVGSASMLRNWSQTDSDSVENVIQSNFMRSYRAEVLRARELSKMPNEVKTFIQESMEKLMLEEREVSCTTTQ